MTSSAPRRSLVGLALVAAVLCLSAAPAALGASAPPALLEIRRVDSTDLSNVVVTFTYAGQPDDVNSLKLAENGDDITSHSPATLVNATVGGTATVVVIDASESAKLMLDPFKQAVLSFLATTQGSGQTAIVATNKLASLRAGMTADTNVLTNAVNSITSSGEGGVWSGVESAVRSLRLESALVPNIVIVTDGNGLGSQAQASPGVIADVLSSGATVYTVALNAQNLDPTSFQALANQTGGGYVEVTDTAAVQAPLEDIGKAVAGTYQVTYASKAEAGLNRLDMSVGSSATRVSFVSGSMTNGSNALAYQAPIGTGGLLHVKYFQEHGKTLGVVLVLIAAVLGAYAIGMIFVRDTAGLTAALRPYSDGYNTAAGDDDDEAQGAAQTAFIQRAVALTGQFAERRGFLTKVEDKLERANMPLRAAEAIFFFAAASTIATLLVLVITRNPLVTVIALLVMVLLPPAILNFMAGRRKKKFRGALPDMLQLLSGTLRAGYSMMQGVEAVSQEIIDPMGSELRRVVTEARLGRPLEESLDAVAVRMDSPDFAWAVMAIRIQREVGGNLSELLLTVSETMTQRERLRRDINGLTAEGRVSAIVLGILPIALGLAMYVINPEYMSVLIHESIGHLLLLGGVLLMGAGFAWMWKMIQIEV
jgi:tight adherence protein B